MPGTPPTSPRFGIPRPSDADAASFSAQVNPIIDGFDAATTGYRTGTTAAMGAASSYAGYAYLKTDAALGQPSWFVSNGTVWQPIDIGLYAAGDLKVSAIAAAPAGWLTCNGSAISRTTYAALFAAIATAYGSGNGTTTFNIPDLQGRSLLGAGAGAGLTARTPGQEGGEETHLLATDEMPSHQHLASGGQGFLFYLGSGGSWTATSGSNATVSGSTPSAGGGGSHNNMQPYTVVSVFIKI